VTSFADTNKLATIQAFDDPQVGDRFHEMLSYWVYVVARDGERITVMDAIPPCSLPKDGRAIGYDTLEAFRAAFRYPTNPGYWVRLADRGHDVSGWLEGKEINQKPDTERICRTCWHWSSDSSFWRDGWRICQANQKTLRVMATAPNATCEKWRERV
jgi:hypothetical protein